MNLLKTLEFIKGFLEERSYGKDLSFKTLDGYEVDLFWHEPSINVGWYPILQIEKCGKMVFWNEGTENPDYWFKLANKAIEKLCR